MSIVFWHLGWHEPVFMKFCSLLCALRWTCLYKSQFTPCRSLHTPRYQLRFSASGEEQLYAVRKFKLFRSSWDKSKITWLLNSSWFYGVDSLIKVNSRSFWVKHERYSISFWQTWLWGCHAVFVVPQGESTDPLRYKEILNLW